MAAGANQKDEDNIARYIEILCSYGTDADTIDTAVPNQSISTSAMLHSHPSEEIFPKCLCRVTKKFESVIASRLTTGTAGGVSRTVLMEELRQLAFLEYRIQMVNLDISLWTSYFESGSGNFKDKYHARLTPSQRSKTPMIPRPSIWPTRLKSIILTDPNVSEEQKQNLHSTVYLNYVKKKLIQLQEQLGSYQKQIQARKQGLKLNLTSDMEQVIINYIEQNELASHRITIEGFIAAIEYNYIDRMLELEFKTQHPNREHINHFQSLTNAKFAYENAKMDVELLKQRVAHQQPSVFLESFQLPAPAALETIEDESTRQELKHSYEQLFEKTASELIALHFRTAEVKVDETQKRLVLGEQILRRQNSYQGLEFNDNMSEILHRRYKLIEQRLETLLHLKVRLENPPVNIHQQ